MQVLYVHGMGRSPVSGWPMLRRLRRAGLRTCSFGHWVSWQSTARIISRLGGRLEQLAAAGDYVVVGHSLGGVLLRLALRSLPPTTRPPRHLFLLGSPVQVSSIAARLGPNPMYRLLTGDCGRMLGSAARMAAIGPPGVPVTAIVGVKGWSLVAGLLPREPNDGVVTVSETSAPWLQDVISVPVTHMLLPSDAGVTAIILQRLQAP
jgi:pimeloyl-ACP methyl ester carboxylesterase